MSWRPWAERFKGGDSVASFSKKLGEDDATTIWSQGTTDSWIELGPPSRGSLSSSNIDAALLIEAQASAKGSRMSPLSLASPMCVEAGAPNLELVNEKLLKGKGGADWLWDWSSRPEATPPKEYRERRGPPAGLRVAVHGDVASSTLTTPPNSPAPRVDAGLAFRHSNLARSQFFRVEVVFGLVVSNLFTFFMGACIGYYICKKVEIGDADRLHEL